MVAEVVLEEQEPLYVIVPASEEENVYSGEVAVVLDTAETSASVAAVESRMNVGIVTVLLT